MNNVLTHNFLANITPSCKFLTTYVSLITSISLLDTTILILSFNGLHITGIAFHVYLPIMIAFLPPTQNFVTSKKYNISSLKFHGINPSFDIPNLLSTATIISIFIFTIINQYFSY